MFKLYHYVPDLGEGYLHVIHNTADNTGWFVNDVSDIDHLIDMLSRECPGSMWDWDTKCVSEAKISTDKDYVGKDGYVLDIHPELQTESLMEMVNNVKVLLLIGV